MGVARQGPTRGSTVHPAQVMARAPACGRTACSRPSPRSWEDPARGHLALLTLCSRLPGRFGGTEPAAWPGTAGREVLPQRDCFTRRLVPRLPGG